MKHAKKLDKESDRVHAIQAAQMILDYCALVRGILNDNKGDVLRPAGMEMVKALTEVQASIRNNLNVCKKDFIGTQMAVLNGCIAKGVEIFNQDKERIQTYTKDLGRIANTLYSKKNPSKQ